MWLQNKGKTPIDVLRECQKRMALAIKGRNYPIHAGLDNLYFADMCVPSPRLIIEYDGAYWHQDKAKETIRDANLRAAEWKVNHIVEPKGASRKELDVLNGDCIAKITNLATA